MTAPHPLTVTRRKAVVVHVDLVSLLATVLWADMPFIVAATQAVQLATMPDAFGFTPAVIRTDLGKAYVRNAGTTSTIADWDELTDLPDIPWLPGGHNPLSGDLAYIDIVADSPMIIGVSKIPVATAAEVVPEATPATYTVISGDTLPIIGTRFNIPWQIIAEWNDIVDPFNVTVGQVLRLTAPPPVVPPIAAVQIPMAGATTPGGQFSTTSTTFTTVAGPTVNINLVTGQAVAVTITVKCASTTDGQSCFASFFMTGPGYNLDASVVALEARGVENGSFRWNTSSRTTKQVAGTGGAYTLTAVYKTSLASSAAKFMNPYLIVNP